ncbi:uncharacterized protein EI90DRAFT_3018018 [Cantharellus anzutake]|uniref:uncharacterized protein n=1 Tax=Cantharellus anzutake TaxID=1750568 RepID=UPI00190503D2|nr:uncharacterized protein EI90DRAFT_3018018 [Cantharellus anzutake]KAF8327776.1 hypothetical protein EI90DRAFT_3018018 [Cantharellus anzutake]
MGQAYTREGSQPVFGSNSRRGGWYKSLEDGFENRSSTAGLSAGSVTRLAIYKAPEGFCVMIVSFRKFSGNNRRGTRSLGARQIPPRDNPLYLPDFGTNGGESTVGAAESMCGRGVLMPHSPFRRELGEMGDDGCGTQTSLAGNTLIVGLYDSTGSQPAYHDSKYQISEDSTFWPGTQAGYHAGRPTPRTPSPSFKRQADGQFQITGEHCRPTKPRHLIIIETYGACMGKDREGLFGDT